MKLRVISSTIWIFLLVIPALSIFLQPQYPCDYSLPHDPGRNEQWYLDNGPPNYGINVVPAWRQCINGSGVTVGVVDTGIDRRNPDLQNKVVYPQSFQPPQYQHGTEVSGLISAEANNVFGTGIAFGANLADLAYVQAGRNIPINALAFSRLPDLDIYSCSFSRSPDGQSVYKIPDNLRLNMAERATQGRSGKGSLIVISSGNGGTFFSPESCAYDEFMNNVNTILVAGVGHSLESIPAGEKCSAIMITAPTRTIGYNNLPLMLTTSGSGITTNFGQTSAAVAIASGSLAVLLSARRDLTNRDVMHILTRTGRVDLPYKSPFEQFKCNGAGFKVSLQYGFGLLDVGAMVELSKSWRNVGPKVSCEIRYQNGMHRLSDRKLEYTFQIDGCSIRYIEHIEVTISVPNYAHAGLLTASLTSPLGFESAILPGRGMDYRTSLDITISTVQFWGNDAQGTWKLNLENKYNPIGSTTGLMRLKFHGLKTAPLLQLDRPCAFTNTNTQVQECKETDLGTEYVGFINKSKTGRNCLRWDSSRFRNIVGDQENYCRNPDRTSGGPWCYTLGSEHGWEFCNVPFCRPPVEECKRTDLGTEYAGFINKSMSGRHCLRWDSSRFRNTVGDQENYCRNPDRTSGGPWCYTLGSEHGWEFCNVPYCSPQGHVNVGLGFGKRTSERQQNGAEFSTTDNFEHSIGKRTSDNQQGEKDHLATGVIVGIVAGCVICFGIVIVVIVFIKRKSHSCPE